MEQENNKNDAEVNAAEALPKSEASGTDIAKSMAKNFLKTRKAAGISDAQRKKPKKKNQTVSEVSREEKNKKLSREENQEKDATTNTELLKSEEIKKNQENISDSRGKGVKLDDSPNKRQREEEPGVSGRNWKSKKKQKGNGKTEQIEKKENQSNSEKNNKIKEKNHDKEKRQEHKKKEKIDGLIFMCNAKTKPDCFHYRVMGVSQSKKDLVLGIRWGLKLFLYDYDLKLMYGIYKASSSGGMKLEPKAFGGAFPAQVQFSVHADCFPLAESIFKRAIKENYNEQNKFKTELTARQVWKLTELFRSVAVHPTALTIHEHAEDREARDRAREARPSLDREASARYPYANISVRSYSDLSHERDQWIPYGKLASTQREDIRHDLYLKEKEYRTYGLHGERRNLILKHSITPTLAFYPRDYGEQLPRQPHTVYRESVPMQRDKIHSGPLHFTEREYRGYALGASTSVAAPSTLNSYATDPYLSRYYGTSLVDSYLPRPRAEADLRKTDNWRRETNQVDKLYSTYASDALADYNWIHHHQDFRPEAAPTSVSSRYSFAGHFLIAKSLSWIVCLFLPLKTD